MQKKPQLGTFIRDARLALDMSQREVREATGILEAHLSAMENGGRGIPRKHLGALSDALKLSPEERAELRRLWDLDMDAREAR